MISSGSYEDSFRMGYQEGFLIGQLESAYALYETGIITIAQAAEALDMNEVEFRARLSLGFDETGNGQKAIQKAGQLQDQFIEIRGL
ncbi:MAG: UPF0175 family protein [Oscillospiraceae bacterium]|nr:UPF0175 family protein [Oscillospiraceae bacterium]